MDVRARRFARVAAVRARLASRALAAAVLAREEEARSGAMIARLTALGVDYAPEPGAAGFGELRRRLAFGTAVASAAKDAKDARVALITLREQAEAALRGAEREVRLADTLRDAALARDRRARLKAELAAQSGTIPASWWTRGASQALAEEPTR